MAQGKARRSVRPCACQVLLVEDEATRTGLGAGQLAGSFEGVAVKKVTTLEAARQALAKGRVDCVLLALDLAGSSVRDALGALSSLDGPPVIVLTNGHSTEEALDAIARGADDCLSSQTPTDEIVQAVRFAIARREARRLLGQEDAHFGWAIGSLRQGIVVHDGEGRLVHHNDAARRLLGYRPRSLPELRTATATSFLRPDLTPLPPEEHPARIAFESRRAVVGTTIGVRLPTGNVRWLRFSSVPLPWRDGLGGVGVVTSFEDVTDRQRVLEALEDGSLHDPLTHLPSRALVLDRLEQALQRNEPVAVALVDVDGFNSLNDSYGFDTGDRLLVELAERLRARANAATVGRLSADTFAIVLEAVSSLDEALERARGLREAATGHVALEDVELYVVSSAGVAFGYPGATPESLVRTADLALHRAKAAGGGAVLAYGDGDLASVRERLELGRDLRQAIELGALSVAYQPIVRTGDLAVVGVEALARWDHPEHGVIGPERFVELACDLGLIHKLTDQMLTSACSQVAAWQAMGIVGRDFQVAVNLAASDLADDLAGEVAGVLRETGLDAGCLTVEVTETGLVADAESALSSLQALRRLGVHVAIDDFGTGYSSLSYLRRFPIDAVKIDKSFINGLGHNPDATTLARGIVSLATSLGLLTIAEGIENNVQLEALRQLGCPLAQGYLWSEPVPAELVPALLSELAAAREEESKRSLVVPRVLRRLGEGVGWAALDSLQTPVAVVDADGTILATNLPWQRVTLEGGGSATDCGVGANYFSACEHALSEAAEEAAKAASGLRAVLSGEREQFALEYDCSTPEEERRFLLLISPLVGRVALAVVAHVDITERHRTERALAESHQRFQSLVDQAPVGILRLSPTGRILDTNPALCAIVGRSAEELFGMASSALFGGEEAEGIPASGKPGQARRGEHARSRRWRVRRPDGELRIVEVSDVVAQGEDDRVSSVVATVQDVTDQLRLTEELRRAQELEALGRVAAGIAHEINTPSQFISDNLTFLSELWPSMKVILSTCARLGAPELTAEQRQVLLEELTRACSEVDLGFALEEVPAAISQSLEGAERVAGIVRAMKAFGHPDRAEPETVDLNQVVANTVTVARNETKQVADLTVELGDLPRVSCFPGSIGQALLNLLVNAAQAIGQNPSSGRDKGTIRVSTHAQGDEVAISVEDDGPGIPEEALPHIFEPFFTTKPVGEGTGQGLALVWTTIVERHHGRIDVDTSPSGTRFTCTIPVSVDEAGPKKRRMPAAAASLLPSRATRTLADG